MSDSEINSRINNLNVDLLNTLASLGEFVVAQNATLIELARLVAEDRKSRNDLQSLSDLSDALGRVQEQSHAYVRTLRASVTQVRTAMSGDSDA